MNYDISIWNISFSLIFCANFNVDLNTSIILSKFHQMVLYSSAFYKNFEIKNLFFCVIQIEYFNHFPTVIYWL